MAPSEPTALALLDAYLYLLRYSPNSSTWSAEAFADNRFRSICYKRVEALARAAEVPLTLFTEPYLAQQIFEARPDGWDAALIQEIESYVAVPEQAESTFYERQLGPIANEHRARYQQEVKDLFTRDLATIFTQYLNFLTQLQKIQCFNTDWLMASSAGARFSIGTTKAIAASLDQPAIDRLRQFMAGIIDPAGRCYSQAELVARFGFPAEDMARLEADSF